MIIHNLNNLKERKDFLSFAGVTNERILKDFNIDKLIDIFKNFNNQTNNPIDFAAMYGFNGSEDYDKSQYFNEEVKCLYCKDGNYKYCYYELVRGEYGEFDSPIVNGGIFCVDGQEFFSNDNINQNGNYGGEENTIYFNFKAVVENDCVFITEDSNLLLAFSDCNFIYFDAPNKG